MNTNANRVSKRRKPSMAKHLRSIAEMLAGASYKRFPLYLKAAAREISELRYENGVLRRKLGMKQRKNIDSPHDINSDAA